MAQNLTFSTTPEISNATPELLKQDLPSAISTEH